MTSPRQRLWESTSPQRRLGGMVEPRSATLRNSDSWSHTEMRSLDHSHAWIVHGFSQCEVRYLETTVKVRDSPHVVPPSGTEPGSFPFRVRLHPQGNKESNKDFTFFQVFCSISNVKYRAKFTVYNASNESTSTTVYTGTQQLHGYFEYIRRENLIQHLAPEDELHLKLDLHVTFDMVTRSSQTLPRTLPEFEPKPHDVTRDLETMFRERRLTDFTIHVGHRQLEVHKVVLAARSPYFAALLSPHTKEYSSNQLILKEEDIEFEVLYEMLLYMYTGRCPRLPEVVHQLLAAADRFSVNGLKEAAEICLRGQLSTDNVCRTLVHADTYGVLELKHEAIRFICTNSPAVLQTDGWAELLLNKPELVTEVVQAITERRYVPSTLTTTTTISCEPPAPKRVRNDL